MRKTALSDALQGRLAQRPAIGAEAMTAMRGAHVGRARPMGAGDVSADLPAGVYQDQYSQAVTPFAGAHQLPTGQTINVSMNAPSPHLTFREWAARGLVAGVGSLLAWPFRLVGGVVEQAAHAVVAVLKWIMILLLLPTMLIVGAKMASDVTSAASVEEGVERIVHHGRHAVNGASKGASGELPPERIAPKGSAKE